MAFVQVVENRLRIQQGTVDVQKLSPQQLLSCNYLNEGCKGGLSIFNGFFAEYGGLVSEDCASYESSRGVKCSSTSTCQPVAKVTKSYFLHQSNSHSPLDQKEIQKELLLKGPVVADMKVPKHFEYFKSGTLVEGEEIPLTAT